MDADNLDMLDELLTYFRPIEKLFRVMGAVDTKMDEGVAQQCSEIGLMLTGHFRKELEQAFSVVVVGRGADVDR